LKQRPIPTETARHPMFLYSLVIYHLRNHKNPATLPPSPERAVPNRAPENRGLPASMVLVFIPMLFAVNGCGGGASSTPAPQSSALVTPSGTYTRAHALSHQCCRQTPAVGPHTTHTGGQLTQTCAPLLFPCAIPAATRISFVSRIRFAYPCRATSSIASPTCCVVNTEFGNSNFNTGINGFPTV
jgi:hypothetical protein